MLFPRGGSFRVPPAHSSYQSPLLDDTIRTVQPHVNVRMVMAGANTLGFAPMRQDSFPGFLAGSMVGAPQAMGQESFPGFVAGSMVAAPIEQQPLPVPSTRPDNWVSIFTRPDGIGDCKKPTTALPAAISHARAERKAASKLPAPCPSARQPSPFIRGGPPCSRLEEGLAAATSAAPVAAGRFGGWATDSHQVVKGGTPERLWPSYHDEEAGSECTGSDRTLEPDDYRAGSPRSPRRKSRGGPPAVHNEDQAACTEAPALGYQYKCPGCSFVSSSMQEALSHCENSQTLPPMNSSMTDNSVLRPALTEMVSVIAFNDVGEPSLLIRRDPATGKQRTVARNDDGTESVFGDDTVRSMVENTEDTMASWLDSLNVTELKGLLNEINHHVAEGTRLYHQTKTEVEQMNREASYSFFGLAEDASEKELDNAYRQLAKKMHPDKNDGTDDAKVKFQQMKDHYEALKRQRAEAQGRGKENCENRGSNEDDVKADVNADCKQSKAEDQNSSDGNRPKQAGLAELLAEKERGPLDEAARHYLTVLKNIKSNMSILQREQHKFASATSP